MPKHRLTEASNELAAGHRTGRRVLRGSDYLEILTLIAPIDYWLRLVVFVSALFEIDI